MVPIGGMPLQVSNDDRYRNMLTTFGRIATYGNACGMHVHVGVDSDEEGVAVIDRIAPWLPILVAIAANSPFHDGEDTGYASWRSETWRRWPSAGVTEQFGSAAGYRAASRFLMESGAASDERMLYYSARLSRANPTVEIRVADVCTDPADGLLVAALSRGLVEQAARDAAAGREADPWRAEALRACHWRAARYSVSGTLVHPQRRERAPAHQVLDALAEHLDEVLGESGDRDLVSHGIARVTSHTGASLQRAAFERSGKVEAVVDDLIERTRAAWED
jgi:carboxylate-amine ligase